MPPFKQYSLKPLVDKRGHVLIKRWRPEYKTFRHTAL